MIKMFFWMSWLCCHLCATEGLDWEAWAEAEAHAIELMEKSPIEGRRAFVSLADELLKQTDQDSGEMAVLHYNLGNIYHWSGDQGQSILHYRHAQELAFVHNIGNIPFLEANLWAVRHGRIDQLPHSFGSPVMQKLREIKAKVPMLDAVNFFIWGLVVLQAVLWIKKKRIVMSRLMLTLGLFLAITVVNMLPVWIPEGRSDLVVTAEEVVLRKGPGIIYGAALDQPLHAGTELQWLSKRKDWHQVVLSDGRTGWAYERGLGVVCERGLN